MSGIYIKGMEMPKRDATFLVHVNGDTIDLTPPRKYAEEYHREREIYKLIPVPDHGRLIDAEALAKEIEYARFHHSHTDGLAARHHVAEYGHFLNALSEFPTIIPGDKNETPD